MLFEKKKQLRKSMLFADTLSTLAKTENYNSLTKTIKASSFMWN